MARKRFPFALLQPAPEALLALCASWKEASFSCISPGITLDAVPAGFDVDRREILLGNGEATFLAACKAFRRWRMFRLPWIQIACLPDRIEPGTMVSLAARAGGLWAVGVCRIVYVIEEPRRLGFAYGTVMHVENGEERFLVEWREDDSVWYSILAYSRPANWLVWSAYPFARYCQRAFGLGSFAAVRQSVADLL